jgi:hypothetical protein
VDSPRPPLKLSLSRAHVWLVVVVSLIHDVGSTIDALLRYRSSWSEIESGMVQLKVCTRFTVHPHPGSFSIAAGTWIGTSETRAGLAALR